MCLHELQPARATRKGPRWHSTVQLGTCQCVLEEDATHRGTCALLDMPVEHQGTARPRGQYDTCLGRRVCSACTLLHCSPPSLHARRVSAEAYGAPYMYQVPTGTHLHANTNTDRSQAKQQFLVPATVLFTVRFNNGPSPWRQTRPCVIGLLMVCTLRATAPSPAPRLQRPLAVPNGRLLVRKACSGQKTCVTGGREPISL